jgi:hypothetical protein
MPTAKTASSSSSSSAAASAKLTAQIQKLAANLQALASQFRDLGLPELTSEDRVHSSGRLRGGEAAAITSIFDAMDAFPGVFAALAAKDGGEDPAAVETAPGRAALAQATTLAPLAAAIQAFDTSVSDAILASAAQAKDVSVPAYAIGKASAASDPKVRKSMAAAMSFYSRSSQRLATSKKIAATKAKNAKKPSTASA